MNFTDNYIKNLSTEKRLKDTLEGDGFGVRVYGTGAKIFYFAYTFDGKRRFLNLGTYDPKFETVGPDGKKIKSLAYHRQKYIDAKNKLHKGIDPLTEKDKEKAERKRIPFMADLCTDYIELHAKPNKKSWELDDALIKREILPYWGKWKAADISDRDIKVLLNAIVGRGAPVSANRVRSLIHMLFEFAIEERILTDNPCAKVKKPTKETPVERDLSADEIRTLWRSLDGSDIIMSQQTRNVLKIILLTAQRPGEVVGMHSDEIDGNWWEIPATRTKNKRAHRVYLTDSVLSLIGDINCKGYIFPAGRGADGHMTENSLSFALRRNIKGQSVGRNKVKRRNGEEYKRGPYKTEKPAPENTNRIGVEMFTPHDLRRTATTLMASSKYPYRVSHEDRERVLNHTLSKLDRIYNRHDYDDEKQAALLALERRVLSIVNGVEQADTAPATEAEQQALAAKDNEIAALRRELEALKQSAAGSVFEETGTGQLEAMHEGGRGNVIPLRRKAA